MPDLREGLHKLLGGGSECAQIDLAYNNIDDRSADDLEALLQNTSLTRLRVTSCEISAYGFQALCRCVRPLALQACCRTPSSVLTTANNLLA